MTTQVGRQLYFLGELGVFVQFALGVFEKHFDRFPDAQIDILTFPDFGKILTHLYPDNISVTPYEGPPLGAHRFGIGLVGDYPKEVDAIVAGRDDLSGLAADVGVKRPLYFAKQPIPNEPALRSVMRRLRSFVYWRTSNKSGPYFPVLNIRTPLTLASGPEGDPGIVLLPRFRPVKSGADRNLESDFWNSLIADHLLAACKGHAPVYICGLPAERVEGLAQPGVAYPDGDILDEIRLLNAAKLLICPLSGYGQLASFAGADVLYVLPPTPVAEEERHIATLTDSNVFGRRVDFIRQDALLANPQMLLARIEESSVPEGAMKSEGLGA